MDGAVQAGERAAREVLHQMGKISENDIHQDEPPSTDVIAHPCKLTTFQQCLPSVPVFLTGMFIISSVGGYLSYKYLIK